jgi:AraC-like DNA-binding protein
MRHKLDMSRDAAVSLLLLKDSSLKRRVLKILEMVEAGRTFAIRDLAAEFRLSPAYLQRLFKAPARFRKQNEGKYDGRRQGNTGSLKSLRQTSIMLSR